MNKTHYFGGCLKGRYHTMCPRYNVSVTKDISQVTCKNCLKIIEKKNLQPRSNFPEVPTFSVVAEGRLPAPLEQREKTAISGTGGAESDPPSGVPREEVRLV